MYVVLCSSPTQATMPPGSVGDNNEWSVALEIANSIKIPHDILRTPTSNTQVRVRLISYYACGLLFIIHSRALQCVCRALGNKTCYITKKQKRTIWYHRTFTIPTFTDMGPFDDPTYFTFRSIRRFYQFTILTIRDVNTSNLSTHRIQSKMKEFVTVF
ncbi:hypothetical protein M513_00689 [Trichuris suis]|uniref:Uncharacterized protein n=1 Tax=Trichuris suis TaxID=68888 RepID=A0A085MML7_9BILA|nr:hypothetical protein M513_00689 [Trichuris suis]